MPLPEVRSSRPLGMSIVAALVLTNCALSHPARTDASNDRTPQDTQSEAGDAEDTVDVAMLDGDTGVDADTGIQDVQDAQDAPDAFDAPDVAVCDGGLRFCGAVCVDVQTDPRNCGGCGVDCAGLPGVQASI